MVYHILNGDSLAYSFPEARIEGEIVVVREGLIDGDLSGNKLGDFWHSRAKYLGVTDDEYHDKVVSEFKKVMDAPNDSEFNLWFEYDLFCQVNMWFVLSIINSLPVTKTVYAVYTSYLNEVDEHFWNGFGPANSNQLQTCYAGRILLTDAHLQLGDQLWTAYKKTDLEKLLSLAESQCRAFPYLKEVVKAHIDRFPKDDTKGRPEKDIEDITKNISTDFNEV